MAEDNRPVVKLPLPNFVVADNARRVLLITMEPTWPMDAVLEPLFWTHVGHLMRPRDKIEAWSADNSVLWELRVLEADRLWAKVAIDEKRTYGRAAAKIAEEVPEGYELRLMGQRKICVIRLADREVLSDNHASRDAALIWLKRYANKIAA